MKLILRCLYLTLFGLTLVSVTAFSQTATIATDQPDYSPGSTATITGSGFQAGETVTLQVLHYPTCCDDATSSAHLPWTVTADANGNVSSTWLVPGDQDELGATLQLTAVGQSSGLQAQVTFTDANSLTIGANSVSPANICAGSTSVPIHSFSAQGRGPNATITGLNFVTSGTYVALDIVNFKLFSTVGSTFTSPTLLATISSPAAAGTQTFPPFSVNTGNNGTIFLWITMDVASSVTDGHTIAVGTTTSANITSNAGSSGTSGSGTASGTQTLKFSVGGSVSGSTSVCSGANSGSVTLSGQTGSVVKWQSSTDNFVSNIVDISNTTTSQSYSNLTQATSYRAVVQSGVCATANSSSATITINTAPSFTLCPGNLSVNNDAGVCTAKVTYTATAAGSPAPTLTYAFTGATTGSGSGTGSGSTFNKGVTNVTLTAHNTCSPDATCSFTVTVTDNEIPVITAPANIIVSNDPGVCGASVSAGTATATDNCSVGTPTGTRSDLLALSAVYPVGTTTITWNVTDANGNAALPKTQTVTVTDNEKPVITTNGNKNVNNDAGTCGALVTVSATATDNCSVGTPTGTRSDLLALSAVYPIGTTTITWNVTDVHGNAAVPVIQTVTVTDNEKPVITANGNKNVNNDAGTCGASVTVSAGATDNCSVGTPTGVRSDALALTDPYPVGTTTITWNVTDIHGNAAVPVIQTVTVTDNEKPVITFNGNKNVNNDAGTCGASVTVSAGATDNCSVGTPTGVRSDALALTDPYPVGTTTITWNVTDVHGNAAIAVIQTVTVTDNEKPVITANGNKNVNNDAGTCGASVTVSAGATDNCSVGTPTGVRSDALALTDPYPVGTTTITWNVTDIHGNAAVPVIQTVTVTDNEKPVITSNGNKNVNNDAGTCGASVTVSAGATDNCSVGTPTGVRSDALALTDPYPVGTTTITWNVTDVHGNAAIAVIQTVTVTDNEKPVITSNGDKNVNNDAGTCGASVTVSASATDNCSVGTPTGVRSDALALTDPYPVGTTTITWNVTDIHGNAAVPVIQTVTVTDNEKPVITANGNKNVNNDAGTCGASVTVSAGATDNCSVGTPTGVRSDALALTDPYPVGTTTITWNVTDIHGNAAVPVIQTVTVTDNEKPVITSNGNKNVNNDAGTCGASVTVSAGATDNCSVGTPTGVRSDALALTDPYPVGTTTITWNVTDVHGNAAIAVIQTVTVTDNEKPVITSNGDKNVNNDAGTCGASVTVSASATDNCSVGTPTGVRSDALALTDPYPVGTTTITWNVTDIHGNAAVPVIQTVTVTDNEKPVITAPANISVSNDPGVCGASVAVGTATATDNCSVGTPTGVRSDALALSAVYPVGTTTITWNVTDIHGNAALPKTQTVTVTDNTKPVITAPGNISVSNDPGVCGATVATGTATATDNCSVGTPTGTRSDALALSAVYPAGTTTITWNVTDVNGNAALPKTQTVTVTDNEKPTITCKAGSPFTRNANHSGCSYKVSGTEFDATANDNCSGVTIRNNFNNSSTLAGAILPTGSTTIIWTATDASNNTATCSTTVNVGTTLAATCSNNNAVLYFGYSGDQTSTVTVTPTGGVGPYTVTFTMNRALLCNQVNSTGDEVWTGNGGSTINNTCPAYPGAGSTPSSINTNVTSSYSVTVTLMADADITAIVTDANGCQTTCTNHIIAIDVRCFAGNSGIAKVTMCHRTGSTKNPCVTICVDQNAVQAQLALGDFFGPCTPNCQPASIGDVQNGLSTMESTLDTASITAKVSFGARVYPNPTSSYFNLELKSASNENVKFTVVDALGRVIEKRTDVPANSTLQIGSNYNSGIYFIEVVQGKDRVVLRLAKVF